MNPSFSRMSLAALITASLSGCATYSDLINGLGPERRLSELREIYESPLELTEGGSAFCQIPSETYMVMPEEGKVGTVVVTFLDGREEVLQGDYSGMSLTNQGATTFKGDDEQVKSLFGDAVSALPPAPYNAKLYFVLDKDVLTTESAIKAEEVVAEIVRRDIAEVIIVGHTDTAASFSYNEKLSQRRAEKMRQRLIDAGISPDIITTRAAGEYELLVQTPDNTPEPLNRRVEIDVR
jgi:OOP family OmpA-OmpF porin